MHEGVLEPVSWLPVYQGQASRQIRSNSEPWDLACAACVPGIVRAPSADTLTLLALRRYCANNGTLHTEINFQELQRMTASVFVFNPFAEGRIARGKAFTPPRHQARLAEDLANLPQFLCQPEDVVLLAKRPSVKFLSYLSQAGVQSPDFVELSQGRIDPADRLCQRELGGLRPWAWGPDSVELLEPLFSHVASEARGPYFNDEIGQLYSKVWSAGFLRKVLACCPGVAAAAPWLCPEQETGVAVGSLEDALGAIAAIRGRGHHRLVVKQAYGLAGQSSLRLWEPELLPAQRQWLVNALKHSLQLVVEPWLERELDFSVQLEMGPSGLELRGYTGLITDLKGQFLANRAEPTYRRCLPTKVASLIDTPADASARIEHLYGEIFALLEAELRRVGFAGPVSIDAFVYRTSQGDCRLKPVVEINPRYTMGRLTVELMKHVYPGSCGLFRLVSRAQARAEGFADFPSYACSLGERLRLHLEGGPVPKIRQGALCLNDPAQVQVCLATFEVSPTLNLPASRSYEEHPR
jgi:hypothetical protein